MDAAPPTVTSSVYSNGAITITANEPLARYGDFEISISHAPVNDSDSYELLPREHFTVGVENGTIVITLNEEVFSSHPLQSGDQLEIALNGIGDYAKNMIRDEWILVVITEN
ncbi:hypothetical protein D3C77_590630 [compost metagenome]